MKIDVVAVGKLKEKYLKEGISEYLKRLKPFVKLKITEVADEPHKDNLCAKMPAQVMEAEASRIEKHIRKSSFNNSFRCTRKKCFLLKS